MATEKQREQNVRIFEAMIDAAYRLNKTIKPLADTHSLARVKPAKGCWYFFALCWKCGHGSPLFRDASKGRLGNPFNGPGGFRAPCYFCAQEIRIISRVIYPAEWI